MPSDLRLLEIDCEVRDGAASRGRERVPPLAVLALAGRSRSLVFPRPIPAVIADRLTGTPEQIGRILEAWHGPVTLTGGPCYLAGDALQVDPSMDVLRWTDPGAAERVGPCRVSGWTECGWSALANGADGPWAMVLTGGRVSSICHTARDSPAGVEAGTWTDPAFRGRGFAAAATAAWAGLPALAGRPAFYSTTADNLSSQRVAERLRLRRLGELWTVRPILSAAPPT